MALYMNISLQLNGNIVNTSNKTWVIWEKSKKKIVRGYRLFYK